MKIPIVLPYKIGSSAVNNLITYLGCNKIRERYTYNKHHAVINYGVSQPPTFLSQEARSNCVNSFEAVKLASNKLLCFGQLSSSEVPHPEYTTDFNKAKEWSETVKIVNRSLLSASSGKGMLITDVGVSPVTAVENVSTKLWVKYIPKKAEYRVHVFNGEVIDTQQKKRRQGVEANGQIRNLEQGWVFTREGVVPPRGLNEAAIKAVQSLGLVFGAVDLIWNQRRNQVYVLEVNTAPGLEGTTVELYGNAIIKYCGNL